MLETLTHADFAPHVNTYFRLQRFSDTSLADAALADAALDIKLIRVEEYTSAPNQERFALFFLAPHETPVQQGAYQLDHEQLGRGVLFLVPISRDQDGLCLEAVFNRQLKVVS
ncbi:DUF6916 family protein [Tabrizicola sp.]|uniref:DUF6916 family protein n=1 Tax=Tabrizicola sp. TaxID=2005166 RepID=UPI00286D423B|nr:hypothetical protein [Tabrizicola sp.]